MPRVAELPAGSRLVVGQTAYAVDPTGGVWSRKKNGGGLHDTWLRLKPNQVGKYHAVRLAGGNADTFVQKYVHHIVLEAFVGPCPVGMEAMHLNDVQTDNRAGNLEWGTHARNCELRSANGKLPVGVDHYQAKLDPDRVRWLRASRGKMSLAKLAASTGVSIGTVRDVLKGKIWRHVI